MKFAFKWFSNKKSRQKVSNRVAEYQKTQTQLIEGIWGKFGPKIKQIPKEKRELICNSSITDLIWKLETNEINYPEMYLSYFERVYKIGFSLNLLSDNIHLQEVFSNFENLEELKFDPKKPLANIPFSIKDLFITKGAPSTFGFAYYLDNISEKDGDGLKFLKNEFGVTPFTRGNTPQGNFVMESNNFIWGRALNPFNTQHSTGGSSGGDAALVASRCVPFSIGTDIGGSLRGPGFHCGVVTLKCTHSRFPEFGLFAPFKCVEGQLGLRPLSGFITKTVEDQKYLMQKMFEADPLKHFPLLTPIPWRQDIIENSRKLKIGYVEQFSIFDSCQGLKRSIRETAESLRKLGHTVVETQIPQFDNGVRIYLSIQSANYDYTKDIKELLDKSEPPIPEYKIVLQVNLMPSWLRPFQKPILKLMNKERMLMYANYCKPLTVNELYLLQSELVAMNQEFDEWMMENKFDALVIPPSALPAYRNSQFQDLTLPLYTWVFNTLDVPAGIVPVSKVMPDETFFKDSYNDGFTKEADKLMKTSAGLPLCVQVISRKFREEDCLRAMLEVERGMGKQNYDLDSKVKEFMKD